MRNDNTVASSVIESLKKHNNLKLNPRPVQMANTSAIYGSSGKERFIAQRI